jgi:hypothetical protein
MSSRALTILWPSFLMAAVLEGFVFSALDPAQLDLGRLCAGISAPGVYTLAFFVFWAIVSTSGALTALLWIDPDAVDPPRSET